MSRARIGKEWGLNKKNKRVPLVSLLFYPVSIDTSRDKNRWIEKSSSFINDLIFEKFRRLISVVCRLQGQWSLFVVLSKTDKKMKPVGCLSSDLCIFNTRAVLVPDRPQNGMKYGVAVFCTYCNQYVNMTIPCLRKDSIHLNKEAGALPN